MMTTTLPNDPLLTIPELCDRLRISRPTLYRLRSQGKPLPKSIRIGKRVLYKESTVIKFLKDQEGKGDI